MDKQVGSNQPDEAESRQEVDETVANSQNLGALPPNWVIASAFIFLIFVILVFFIK